MLALLKIIPMKDLVYGAAILALIIFIYSRGEQHYAAQDAKLTTAAKAEVLAAQTTAQTMETENAAKFDHSNDAPPVTNLGLHCVRLAPIGSEVPSSVPVEGASSGEQSSDGGAGRSFDPSGAALTRAREADAQITYLQGRVHELEQEMEHGP